MDARLLQTVEQRKAEVEAAKSRTTFAEMEAAVAQADPPRNFFAALTRRRDLRRMSIIAEIARKDGAGRFIRPEFAPSPPAGAPSAEPESTPPHSPGFDPIAIARRYHDAGAAAISIVTDPERGSPLSVIDRLREAMPLPVLRSDVVVDPWQLWESRAAGADAVRLIAECLTEGQLVDMMILAQQLRLTTLIEARTTEGLLRVRPYVGFPHRAYSLLAINNRAMAAEAEGQEPGSDRPTAPPDVAGTLRVVDLVDDPKVLVSEGGVRDRSDILRLMGAGVRIVICAEETLGQDDPAAAIRELNGLPVR